MSIIIDTTDCCYCGKEITGARCASKDGFCHRHCFHRINRPKTADNLHEVARGHWDPVIAAQVIVEYVQPEIAKLIVAVYNRRMFERWEKLCEFDEE